MKAIINFFRILFWSFTKDHKVSIKTGYYRYEYDPARDKIRRVIPDENGYYTERKGCYYGNARSGYEFKNVLKKNNLKRR